MKIPEPGPRGQETHIPMKSDLATDIVELGKQCAVSLGADPDEGDFIRTPNIALAAIRAALNEGIKAVEALNLANQQNAKLHKILGDRFKRTVAIEEQLMRMANGKDPLPTADVCRKMALKLGVPENG